MKKLILLSIALLLFTISQINAQVSVECTLQDSNGEEVHIELTAMNETPIGGGDCIYDFRLIIEAMDGLAEQNVVVRMRVANLILTHILLAGESELIVPPSMVSLVLPCQIAGTVRFSIVGTPGASCSQLAQLPVELTRFDAVTMENEQVKLMWETASETDNKGFDIERSTDGYKWETLAFVKGAGTTLEKQYYEWVDEKPFTQGDNYYRLKQMDYDDQTEFSEIIVTKVTDKDASSIFPNPTADWLTLHTKQLDAVTHVDIHNAQGQLVRSISNINQQRIDVSDLQTGIYWMLIHTNNSREQIKFVKQ